MPNRLRSSKIGPLLEVLFMATLPVPETRPMLTLPGDAVRQIQWRFADRFDLQMLVQSARGVARGTVARLVAAGERNTHEWTPGKEAMLEPSTRPASRPLSWSRKRAASSPDPRTWRSRSRPLSWRGSMAARPRPAWPVSWLSRPSTSAAPRNRFTRYMIARPPRPSPAKIAQALARRLRAH